MANKKKGARQSRRERLASAQAIPLEEWLDMIRSADAGESEPTAKPTGETAAAKGACLVKDPRTGQSFCIRTTRDTCKIVKGAFLGGPCGG